MKVNCFTVLLLCLLLTAGCAGMKSQAVHPVAKAYGIEGFEQIEALRYTFNAQLGDRKISRSWIWEPGAERITYSIEEKPPVTYNRSDAVDNEELKTIDASFINDQYWLLFPFHLEWDTGCTIEVSPGKEPLPLTEGEALKYTITYPETGGYTPGDAYDLFVDNNSRIIQWIFRKGNSPAPSQITTWENHKKLGSIIVALDHRVPDGSFRIWFTRVAVRLKGSKKWIFPQ